jgi:hypothetical protein
MKKDCVKRLGTDGKLTDIGHSCPSRWWALNIAREGMINGQVIRYADPTTDISLTTASSTSGVAASVTVNGTKDYPPPPTFTWGAFSEHIYYGGTSEVFYLNAPLTYTFNLRAARIIGVSRIAAGITYEYDGKSWQLEVNLFTAPGWGDPDPRPGVIYISDAGTFASYFAMLNGSYYGYQVPSSEWKSYTIDFKQLMKSISDANFPVPSGNPKLVSLAVMAEVRENASVTFDVQGIKVLTGESASDAIIDKDAPLIHWQTAAGKSYTVMAICGKQCVVKIDGMTEQFTGTKMITFTPPANGSASVRGADWCGLFKQGYQNDGVCSPLIPMIGP